MKGGAITRGRRQTVLMLGTVRLMEGGAITRGRRQIVLMLGTVRLLEGGAITRGWGRRQIVIYVAFWGFPSQICIE
jgi:hypothetical protein